ncbi:MAG TPA: hypothetical protein DEA60_05990 [Thermotoga naphthophila]|nr:hypothetical protein [Thermotoga petrophila]
MLPQGVKDQKYDQNEDIPVSWNCEESDQNHNKQKRNGSPAEGKAQKGGKETQNVLEDVVPEDAEKGKNIDHSTTPMTITLSGTSRVTFSRKYSSSRPATVPMNRYSLKATFHFSLSKYTFQPVTSMSSITESLGTRSPLTTPTTDSRSFSTLTFSTKSSENTLITFEIGPFSTTIPRNLFSSGSRTMAPSSASPRM